MRNDPAQQPQSAVINNAVIHDRIAFLADKYGVSRNTVLLTMSITGNDETLLEKLLRRNRFSR